jgi:hypothetical protein
MSEETLFNGIIFVTAVVSAIIIFSKSLTMKKRVSKALREFAAMKGLNLGTAKNPGDILYLGKNRGFPFALERVTEYGKPTGNPNPAMQNASPRAGHTTHTFTRMRITMSGLPAGMTVCRVNAIRKLPAVPGAQDVRTGDPDVDGYLIIKGNNAQEVTRFLTPERLKVIKLHLKGREQFDLIENGLRYERKNAVDNVSELNKVYTRMGEFAASFGVKPPTEG